MDSLPDDKSPGRTAFATFLAFVIAGWAPLLPYMFELAPVFPLSVAFTGLTFSLVGASRSSVTARRWYINGGERFVVGMAVAVVAYTVGTLSKRFA
jgi:VIT1/CCC1 family predicted Fe2+/Mn2+ transporter